MDYLFCSFNESITEEMMSARIKYKLVIQLLALSTAIGLVGCSTYVTPGGPARLDTISNPNIREAFAAKPEANFPASIVFARVQSPGYHSYAVQGYGSGRYSVITMRDFEEDSDYQRVQSLPNVAGAISLSRLLLPEHLDDDVSLRAAAAKLHADMLLIYTVSTEFRDRNKSTPLTVFTLGAAKTKDLLVSSTASAILMDVRTGFVYGALDSTEKATATASAWTTTDAVEASRKKTEQAAFQKLIGEFEPFWKNVVARYRVASN